MDAQRYFSTSIIVKQPNNRCKQKRRKSIETAHFRSLNNSSASTKFDNGHKVFIGGLKKHLLSERVLNQYFGKFGSIVEEQESQSNYLDRGFFFVTYVEKEAAEAVIIQRTHEIQGVSTVAREAVPKVTMQQSAHKLPTRKIGQHMTDERMLLISKKKEFVNLKQYFLYKTSSGNNILEDFAATIRMLNLEVPKRLLY